MFASHPHRPFNRFHFLPEENFSDLGGWVGRAGPKQPLPPPRGGVSLSNGLCIGHAAWHDAVPVFLPSLRLFPYARALDRTFLQAGADSWPCGTRIAPLHADGCRCTPANRLPLAKCAAPSLNRQVPLPNRQPRIINSPRNPVGYPQSTRSGAGVLYPDKLTPTGHPRPCTRPFFLQRQYVWASPEYSRPVSAVVYRPTGVG